MRNFDFQRYTPRPKKLLRPSLIALNFAISFPFLVTEITIVNAQHTTQIEDGKPVLRTSDRK